ncbi:response regulator [Knoellia locipacati]|uniref:response regulator n=1 Tax=Knoellia locipacati TaxID=882824 RepID=UPI00384DAEDA
MTPRRVLLIDDDFSIRLVAQACLERAGWEVSTAASGPEGMVMAETEQPEVILLDVMMPGMDGPATLTRLQCNARTRGIPVVLLTATLPTSDEPPWKGLPVAGVLPKPFDPALLPAQITSMLGGVP